MKDFRLFENETPNQAIYRICKHKDEIGTWEDVGNVLNDMLGENLSSSAYRKKFQYFEQIMKDNEDLFFENKNYLDDLKEMKREIQKEKIKLSDERTELKRLYREQARRESFLDVVKRAISEDVEPLVEPNHIGGFNYSDNDLIVSLTDIHTGIEIDNAFNKFNENILRKRFNTYLQKILEVRERHNSQNCYVIIGEVVSGIIHNNLRIENNLDLMQSFKLVATLISDFLTELSKYFNDVHVYINEGNHSRISPNKEDNIQGENVDVLVPFYLKARLQLIDNIFIHENEVMEEIAMFKVRGNIVMSAHGDNDKVSNVVQKFTMLFDVKPDLVYLGHRHTNAMETVYDTKVIQSGCLSGTDNYALSKRLRNKAEQTISVITEDGLECLYDVKF
jgi:hypothetical protein